MSAATHITPLAITSGEPAGIGPDLCLQLASEPPDIPFVIIGDKNLLLERAALLGISLRLHDYVPGQDQHSQHGSLPVIHLPLSVPCRPGVLSADNSPYVLAILQRALQGCLKGEFAAMVTAPVHKGVINEAQIRFTGHTEFLAEQTKSDMVVMMLVGGGMRVALATTHLPLKEVATAITAPLLERVLRITHRDLRNRFGIMNPRILVAGLNPHAGESGFLGREEIDVMIPVLDRLRSEGLNVSSPLPADTIFTPQKLTQGDCVVCMYHDQGLPVLKHASFGKGVNITLGLPIIRTSVDHGTALDLAGTGKADCGSLVEAIKVAVEMTLHKSLILENPQLLELHNPY